MTYEERNKKADALFVELHQLMGRLVFTSAYVEDTERIKGETVQLAKVAIEGTLNGDDLATLAKFCKRKKIPYWGISARAGERGYLFLDVYDYNPPTK